MDGRNPCDVCEGRRCDSFGECALHAYPVKYECCNYDCFLNHEGDCAVSLFEKCGAWRE